MDRWEMLRAGAAAGLAMAAGVAGTRTSEVHAQSAPSATPKQTVTLAACQTLLMAAEAKAREIGVPMAVATVDEGGLLKAFARMDGVNSAGTVEIVQNKAYTAAAFRTPTHLLAERNASDPTRLASFVALARVTLLGGGYPIMVNGAVVGGIGAGGGTPQQDMMVAEAALAALA